jgi:hypothetical protein
MSPSSGVIDDERRAVSPPEAASEPRAPAEIASADELFLVGEHLEQYRHPTRDPENYWLEAIKRDPGDCRSLIALGRRCIARYEFRDAAELLSKAIKRLCDLHPNPLTGEALIIMASHSDSAAMTNMPRKHLPKLPGIGPGHRHQNTSWRCWLVAAMTSLPH